jgi:hypothetical protein
MMFCASLTGAGSKQTAQLCALALIVTMVVMMIVGMVIVAVMAMMVIGMMIVAIEIGVEPRWWISSPSGWTILSHGKRSSAHQQGRR